MRIGELSRRVGVPVPTIKYYLREGLLRPGVRTGPNQSRYEESHIRRLQLIRALTDVGGLSVAATGEVLAQLDSANLSVFEMLGKVQKGLIHRRMSRTNEYPDAATRAVNELVVRHGWHIHPDSASLRALTGLVMTLQELGDEDILALIDHYAAAAERLAKYELDLVGRRPDIYSMAEAVVVGTVIGDAILASLRRLAEENATAHAFARGRPNRSASKARKSKSPISPQ
jgi:DNA-binding transcriptional MerR regulator